MFTVSIPDYTQVVMNNHVAWPLRLKIASGACRSPLRIDKNTLKENNTFNSVGEKEAIPL